MTETQLKIKVLRMIKKEFPQVWVTKIDSRAISGLPDLILCVPDKQLTGRLFAIELKVGKNTTTKIQDYILSCINHAGGRTAVCRSVEEAKQFLLENK